MVEIYHKLFDAVVEKIANAYDSSVRSLQYVAWKTNDIKKASFADILVQRDKIVIMCEVPTNKELFTVGQQLQVDYHNNHYFKIIYDAAQMPQIVAAIVDSYNQLKAQ